MALAIDPSLPQADILTIKRMIPHRYPFLLIDRVVNIEVNRYAVGLKNVTVNEPHFAGHFPVLPVMPGVLIIEAMAQTSAVLVVETLGVIDQDLLVYFMSIEGAKFRHVVQPGDVAGAARDVDPRTGQDLEVPRRGQGRRHALRRGRVRGDDPVQGRGERERLSPWRPIPPPRYTPPPSSSPARRSAPAAGSAPTASSAPRWCWARGWCCTATWRSPAARTIGEDTRHLPLRLDRAHPAGPEVPRRAGRARHRRAQLDPRARHHEPRHRGRRRRDPGGRRQPLHDVDPRGARLHHRQPRDHGQQRHPGRALRGRRLRDPRRARGGAPVRAAGPRRDDRRPGRRGGGRHPLRLGHRRAGAPRRAEPRRAEAPRQAERDDINGLRAAFAEMFEGEGNLQERVRRVGEKHAGNPLVQEVVEFVTSESARSFTTPAD